MKVLVTGVGGFIGSNIAEHLYKKGYFVIGHCRNIVKDFSYKVYEGDLSKELYIDENIDCVIHAAGGTPKNCIVEKDYYKSNVKTTEVVINYMKKNNIKRMIYLSSLAVYGKSTSSVISENSQLNPDTIYGISKLQAESLLENLKEISSIALEPSVVLGNISEKEWIYRIINGMLNNEKIIYNNKNGKFNCVYIREICNFIEKLLQEDKWSVFQRILISSSDSIIVDEMMVFIKKLLNSDSDLNGTENGIENYNIDISKAYGYGYTAINIRSTIKDFCRQIINI